MRFFFISIFLLSAFCSHSQNYVPFPDSNAVWCAQRGLLHFNSPDTDEWHTYTYQQYFAGDTLINGMMYNKIEESGIHHWDAYPIPYYSGTTTYYHEYVGCIREQNKKIYIVTKYSGSTEYLLYDFNITLGDTLPPTYTSIGSNKLIVTRIDSILISGNYRKQYFISVSDTTLWQFPGYFEYVSLIEGIGSTRGLDWWIMPAFEFNGELWAFKQNGILLYTNSFTTSCEVTGIEENTHYLSRLKIYPNPAKDILTIKSIDNIHLGSIKIIDNCGKVLYTKETETIIDQINIEFLSSGIYFVEIIDNSGRKSFYKFIKSSY